MSYFKKIIEIQKEVSKVEKGGKNPHLKNTYSTLEDVLDALNPSLAAKDLGVIQFTTFKEGSWILCTQIVSQAGEEEIHNYYCPLLGIDSKNPMQALGSAITYARRYSLMAIFKLTPTDDDGVATNTDNSKPARPQDVEKMLRAFAGLHVTKEEIESKYQCDSSALTSKEMEELKDIFKALKDGKVEKIAIFGGDYE